MDEQYKKKVKEKQLELLYHLFAVGVTATAINSSIVTVILWGAIDKKSYLLAWLVAQFTFLIIRILVINFVNNSRRHATLSVRKNVYILSLIGAGIIWGSSAFLGFFHDAFAYKALIAVVIGGMCAGAAATYSALRSAYFGFVIPALLPQIIIFLILGSPSFLALGTMLLIFLVLISLSAETNHRIISSNYRLLFKNEDLIDSLRKSNVNAQSEIIRRRKTEDELIKVKATLELKVKERTQDLITSNGNLRTEIQKRMLAEKALKESEIYYRTIVETAQEGIWVIDKEHRISYVNEKMAQMLGYTIQELQGRDACEFLDTIQQQFHNSDKRIKGIRQKNLRRHDGTLLQVIEAESLLYSDSMTKNMLRLGMVTDITDRQKRERKIIELNNRLQESNSELSEFSHSVSHDLQAPLHTIKAFSELLLEDYSGNLDETGREYIQTITRSTDRMGKLIKDLLTLSRVSIAELHRENVDLSAIAQEIIADQRKREPDRIISIQIESSINAFGDSGMLRIVLENLINNAWKFTSKMKNAEITFGCKKQDNNKIYYVKDNGAGFDMSFKEKLFQPFQRLHSTKEFPGSGVGLATVQRIIRKHGGAIWAESEIGKGSVFYFTIK
ncbi:MAG: PAS domain S-box protein [Fibrobacter sp.]|nr:PAS domain S-box protein [Fibrobacter sp.]